MIWTVNMTRSQMFGRENLFSKKNTKNGLFERTKIGITSLWEDWEDKLLTPGQLLGYTLGYNGSN